jgi:phosphoglycerate dehydrogenase-like enzyme
MKTINILVTSALSRNDLDRIAAVSPKIKIMDASGLWDAPDIVTAERKGDSTDVKFENMLAQAEIIYGYRPPQNVIARSPKLKWIQTMLAGVDHFLTADIVKSRVTVTNTSGIHASPVSEMTFCMMLMFAKQAPFCFLNKQEKKWERFITILLRSKTVGIVGLGSIGRELARMSKAFDMRVIATRRTAKKGDRARYVDLIIPVENLRALLSESDFVVLLLPSTSGTYKMIGEKELRAMKPTAYLINVGRGSTVDEEAMVGALEQGWIAGAGLDAYAVEPLPVDSKLWVLPNVIISPHVSGRLVNYYEVVTELFCDNLKRYIEGKRLRNIVNKKRGY